MLKLSNLSKICNEEKKAIESKKLCYIYQIILIYIMKNIEIYKEYWHW